MIRRIPQNHRWTGPYLGSYYGDLWKTFNVDLDRNEGVIGLSQRMGLIEDSTELPNLSSHTIEAFIRTNADSEDRYWGLSDTGLFKTDSSASASPANDWDTDGLVSTPNVGLSDFTVHGNDSRNDSGKNKLIVTTDSDMWVLNDTGNSAWTGNWWVTKQGQPGLDTSVPHPSEFFPFRKITLIGDGNLVHTISRPSDTQNDTVTRARLVLPKDYVVNHIFTTADRAWLCCYNKEFGEGAVVEWDGFSQTYNQVHSAFSIAALTGINNSGRPLVLNGKGFILEFTGSGFTPMMRNGQVVAFPVAEQIGNGFAEGDGAGGTDYRIARRGVTAGEDGLVYFLTTNLPRPNQKQESGVWCLNPTTGRLYNKHTLTGGTDTVDFGHQSDNLRYAGILWVPSVGDFAYRNILAGGQVNVGASLGGIWLLNSPNSTTANRGYFITQFIPANEVLEFWDVLWLRFRRFFSSSGNSIVVKAKGGRSLTEADGNPLRDTITWTSTTTFTVTVAFADDSLQVGDEVEVLGGPNAGYRVHITQISGAHGALQTITVDEAVQTGSGSGIALFDRWKKLGTITATDKYHQKLNVGIDSSFIHFKVELRGVPNELEVSDLTVVSKPSIQLEN